MVSASQQCVLPFSQEALSCTSEDLPIRLEDVDWSFSDSTAGSLTHGLHPWPAKFIPEVPRAAIGLFSEPGDLVLDPFCGSGTTAVEAAVTGRRFVVADLNPLAVRIAEAKCEVPNQYQAAELQHWIHGLRVVDPEDYLHLVPDIPNRAYWFSDEVAAQLAYLLADLRQLGHSLAFLEVVFSSIVVHSSYQESETRYRRVNKNVDPNRVIELFKKRMTTALEAANLIRQHLDADGATSRQYVVHDARQPFSSLESSSVALAVFSPPYPNAFDYHLYHRFRMFWLGCDPRRIKNDEIGAHLRYQPDGSEWLADMLAFFGNLSRALRPGGTVVCLVGDGLARGELIPSGDLLWDSVPGLGFDRVHRAERDIPGSRKIFNQSFSRIRKEDVLVFSS